MGEFMEFIEDVVVQKHLSRAREEDEELKEMEEWLYSMAIQLEDIMKQKDMDPKVRKLLQEYSDLRYDIEAIKCLKLYLAGVRDGWKVMKEMGIV